MTESILPLSLPGDRWESIETPFQGDVLDRRRLAGQLTGYIGRLREGAVIALDAPWGEGKTWFARHWAAQLKVDGYRVGCIDAFENDYVEDPFLLLAAEVRRLSSVNASLAKRIGDQAAKVGKALVPMAAKMTINFVGKTVGTEDLAGEWSNQVAKAAEKGADVAQAWVKRRIEQHDKERDSMRAFHQELEAFAKDGDEKPAVIIIDELDRCQPAFAVRLLERIKHYFDVPNLVFVLVMNRRQLETAVKGVYGAETDAATYLGKFLHLSLSLPRIRSWELNTHKHFMRGFVDHVLKRYTYDDQDSELSYLLTAWAEGFHLSLREIERVCALCFLAPRRQLGLLTFLVALRVKYPEVFEGIQRDETRAYERATAILQEVNARAAQPEEWISAYTLSLIHLMSLARDREPSAKQQLALQAVQYVSAPGMNHIGLREPVAVMHWLMRSLDFDVQ